jgi:hypothetical protein
MAELFGVMLKIPQLQQSLEEVGGDGFDHKHLANITKDWVNGKSLQDIARNYFKKDQSESDTDAFTSACKALYRSIVNSGTWGLSALNRMSGLDFDKMTDAERRRMGTLPAMIYHGVKTEDAVLMRMNAAPRSAAERLGEMYRQDTKNADDRYSVGKARDFLRNMSSTDWMRAAPEGVSLSGDGYRRVWRVLSGEGT